MSKCVSPAAEAVGENGQPIEGEHAAVPGTGVEDTGRDRIDRQGQDKGVGQAVVDGAPGGATVRALEHAAASGAGVKGAGRDRIDRQGPDSSSEGTVGGPLNSLGRKAGQRREDQGDQEDSGS